MNISVIGISHHTAPVGAREAFALAGDLAGRLMKALAADGAFEESLVLDTCNRTEVYFVVHNCADPMDYLLGVIAELKGVPAATDVSAFYFHTGAAAVHHLFRVAAALDSQIIGEHQILGQLKKAYAVAIESRGARLFLSKVMHRAFRVGKRTQSETSLGRGSASIAQAAVALARQVFTSLAGKSAMLIGAGETGAIAARALVGDGVSNVIVANRTLGRAQDVADGLGPLRPEDIVELDIDADAANCPAPRQMLSDHPPPAKDNAVASVAAQAIELSAIVEHIGEVDLVISATGSPELVLTGDDVRSALSRSGRSVLIVDIAVPRDVDAALDELANVFLYNIDDLSGIVSQNMAGRLAEVPRAQAIIADEQARFEQWYNSRQVTPTIKLLQEQLDDIQQAEIKRHGRKFGATDREQLEKFTRSLCSKILHQPIAFLRSLSKDALLGEQQAAVDIVRKAFQLDDSEDHE